MTAQAAFVSCNFCAKCRLPAQRTELPSVVRTVSIDENEGQSPSFDGKGGVASRPQTGDVSAQDARPVVLDRYRLLERLGGGGMGVVWRAQDLKLGREVALKRIACGDATSARRADRESVAAARLQHPAIVALYESVAEDDQVWLVSELVYGQTLAEALADGALSDRDVLEIGVAVCDALAHAHRHGVIHRDVKPPNILVPDPDRSGGGVAAKLTDFGIAQLLDEDVMTRTGDVVGTLAYMAPEQAEGRGAEAASDLYALGLCLYEALSGVNPVRGRGVGATARRVGQRLPELGRLRRDLPLELCEAIDDAVWPEPGERGTVKDLRAALKRGLHEVSDEPGTIAGAPLEPLAGAPDAALTDGSFAGRVAAAGVTALLAGVTAWIAADVLPAQALWLAPVLAGVVALGLPRLGWLLAAAFAVTALTLHDDRLLPAALLAVLPVPLLLRRAEPWSWPLPGAGLLLAAVGAAVAAPALAVRVLSPLHRALVGLLSAWWVVVAQIASGHGLVPGLAGNPAAHGQMDDNAIAAFVSSPALMFAAVCVAGAVLAPWMVGARNVRLALAGALLWAGALATALGVQVPSSAPELAAGALIAAAIAVLLRPLPPSAEVVQLP